MALVVRLDKAKLKSPAGLWEVTTGQSGGRGASGTATTTRFARHRVRSPQVVFQSSLVTATDVHVSLAGPELTVARLETDFAHTPVAVTLDHATLDLDLLAKTPRLRVEASGRGQISAAPTLEFPSLSVSAGTWRRTKGRADLRWEKDGLHILAALPGTGNTSMPIAAEIQLGDNETTGLITCSSLPATEADTLLTTLVAPVALTDGNVRDLILRLRIPDKDDARRPRHASRSPCHPPIPRKTRSLKR